MTITMRVAAKALVGTMLSTVAPTAFAQVAPATPASSATVDNTGSADGDIVVTAQRREERLQNVGIAVAAFSADSLKARGLSASTDIAQLTPGVYASGSLAGQSQQFTVRGVTQSDFNDAIEAPVAVYVDDVYVPTQQGQSLALFDLQRVEILKGPQGTLFGRNATGGLVQNVVVQPTYDSVRGYVDLSYARFNEVKAEGALNLPVSQNAALRLSGIYTRIDNFWRNVYPEGVLAGGKTNFGPRGPSPCCQDEGGGETLAGRAQFKVEPTDNLTIRLSAAGARQRLSTAPYTQVATIATLDAQGRVIQSDFASPTETRQSIGPDGENIPLGLSFASTPGNGTRLPGANIFGFTQPDPEDLELSSDFARGRNNTASAFSTAAHGDYQLGDVTVTSITAYQRFKKQFLMDADGTAANIFVFGTRAKTRAISQELRFSGSSDSLRWVAGAYYLDIDARTVQGLLAPTGSLFSLLFGADPNQGIDFVDLVRLKTKSVSAFGQIDYEFAPKLTLVVGGRIIRERQNYQFQQVAAANADDYSVDSGTILFPLSAPYSDRRAKTLWAGKVQLEYRPEPGLMFYAGVNRGVKAGSYNAPLPGSATPLPASQYPYAAEVLYNYEGGVKYGRGGLAAGLSVYHYDYQNYQAFLFQNIDGFVTNVDAKTYGVDADLAFPLPIVEGLRATLGASYSHGTIKNYEVAPGVLRTVRPTYAPRKQGSFALSYTHPEPVFDGKLSANADVNYASGFYYNIKNFNSTWYKGRALANFSVNWTQGERGMQVTLFLNNAFDKRYGLVGFEGASNFGSNLASYGKPRSFGGRLAYRF